MRAQTCCFTGHRNITDSFGIIKRKLKKTIIGLIEKGVIFYGSGGALGFDTIAALAVLELKKTYPQIKLIMVLPCHEQEEKWSEKDKKTYHQVLQKADKVVYVSNQYHSGCMFARNRHLVDYSAFCIAYMTENKGGTVYTADYAKKNGLTVINIAV